MPSFQNMENLVVRAAEVLGWPRLFQHSRFEEARRACVKRSNDSLCPHDLKEDVEEINRLFLCRSLKPLVGVQSGRLIWILTLDASENAR